MQHYLYISRWKKSIILRLCRDITGVKACISDDNLFTNPPSVWKVYKDIKQVYGSWSSLCAVRSVKQHEESRYLAARRDGRYFRGCSGNKAGGGIKWINRVRRMETQWKYLSSIEGFPQDRFLDPLFDEEIKSGYRASSCSRQKRQEYVYYISLGWAKGFT